MILNIAVQKVSLHFSMRALRGCMRGRVATHTGPAGGEVQRSGQQTPTRDRQHSPQGKSTRPASGGPEHHRQVRRHDLSRGASADAALELASTTSAKSIRFPTASQPAALSHAGAEPE